MVYNYNMTTKKLKDMKLCKHCDTMYPATKDNFYTSNGKLKLSICRGCKKEFSKVNEKNRKPRDRKAYNKAYHIKLKLKKQELNSKDI